MKISIPLKSALIDNITFLTTNELNYIINSLNTTNAISKLMWFNLAIELGLLYAYAVEIDDAHLMAESNYLIKDIKELLKYID